MVSKLAKRPVSENIVELVERKGIGHPDSIADGIAEAVSRSLCQLYLDEVGEILHHNVDQNEVSGGQSETWFGGGKIIDLPYIILLGRAVEDATFQDRKLRLPVRSEAVKAARSYLKENFHDSKLAQESGFNIEDCIVDVRMGKGSQDLIRNYQRQARRCPPNHQICKPANDTSLGVGYAPFTDTERLTYAMERFIRNEAPKHGLDAVGKDIKVMASRYKDEIHIIIACAIISPRVSDPYEYHSIIEQLKALCMQKAHDILGYNVEISINQADDLSSDDPGDYYLTLSGLSMENGDDGSVGRGNRVNGLITPFRPMSTEAAAGKNPVTHIGKLYNVLASQIASRIANEAGEEILEVQVKLLSQIGSPIDLPAIASVELITQDDNNYHKWNGRAWDITNESLSSIEELTGQIVKGSIALF